MTAKEYLQKKYEWHKKHWNEHEYIDDNWMAQEMEAYAKERIEALSLSDVVKRSPIKMEIDFNGHAKFEVETTDFDMKFIRGVNGWGEIIPCDIVHKNKL